MSDSVRRQIALSWVLAFTLGSGWFWLSPASDASYTFQSIGGQQARDESEQTALFEQRTSVTIGPSNLVGAELAFGFAGGLLMSLATAQAVRGSALRGLLSAMGWAIGAVIGGYVGLVGSYLLGAIGAAVLKPLAFVGAVLGFAAAGWLAGFVCAVVGFAVTRLALPQTPGAGTP